MLLFKKAFWEGLVSGAITLTFRRWKRSHVRPGGRYRCHPIGVLEVDDVKVVSVGTVTARDAKRAGFPSLEALLTYLAELGPLDDTTEIHRVDLHHGGDGDRVPIALVDRLTAEDVEALRAKLARLDGKAPWTAQTFALIGGQPRIAASKLAAKAGRETAAFKADVIKLKKLGLTQSFEVGYEITPRGRAYLAAIGGPRKKRCSLPEARRTSLRGSMKWRKNTGDVWTTRAGPYAVTVEPKGDGRWNWTIIHGEKPNPEATGVRSSLGAAKTACELFVKRSGHV